MANVDFSLLRLEIAEAARQAFEQVRANHPGEHFYAFALYSDESAMTVESSANSEEALEASAQAIGETSSDPYMRWSTGEWAYEAEGGERFDTVYNRISAEGAYDEDEEGAFEAHRDAVFQTMIDALEDLYEQGFFGSEEEREAITLFCSISDSDDAEQLEDVSAKRLNSARVYETFAARYADNEE